MTKKTLWVVVPLLVVAAVLPFGCKPLPFYLQQVCKIYGTATDAKTGDPLESVEVSVDPYQYSELTNSQGDFELEMAVGSWTITFVKDGYETQSVDVTLKADGDSEEVNATLVPTNTGPPADGKIWVQLSGANDFEGKYFLFAVYPPGVRDQAQGLGWNVDPIVGGAAEDVALDSSWTDPNTPPPEMVFTGGETYDVVALIFDPNLGPVSGDPYAEITGVTVDGDMHLKLVYPTDFGQYP